LVGINPEGYRALDGMTQEQLRAEIMKDKKAEKIMADMKAANATSIDQYKAMEGAVSDSLKMVSFSAPAYVSSLRSSEPLVGAYAAGAEENVLSAPIKGNGGVFVLQTIGKEQMTDTFDAKEEETTQAGMHARFAGGLIQDLYQKAEVKDTRYLFF
jgi:peptidyl-prolyl cis-trans isomerase D